MHHIAVPETVQIGVLLLRYDGIWEVSYRHDSLK